MSANTEPGPGCPRQPEAGAYLLGALSPTDRADYVAHLEHCQLCLREVGQLAGLPGLLARGTGPAASARPGSARRSDRADPVAGALEEVHRVRRTRRALVAAGFVLVAGLGLAGSVLVGGRTAPVTGVTAAAELPVRMQPVGNSPVSAALALTAHPWGTEVVMRCRYTGTVQSPVYVLVARSADGATSELARWSAVTDQDMVLASATELVGARLAELEVRNAAGKVLLRADRPS
ncbi:MAG: anti-sigma factor family protein [Pseudonocardia sp.]